MGGYGSGGHNRRAGTIEGNRSLDIMQLHRAGALVPGYTGSWHWLYDDGERADIRIRAERSRIVLSYCYRSGGREWEPVDESVSIVWTPCGLGGKRPWFLCECWANGVYCGRTVGKLYGAGKLFACRHCYRLGYRSQLKREHFARWHQADKLRKKLGGEAGRGFPIAEKPKGMHWATYWRRVEEIRHLEVEANMMAENSLAKFMGRHILRM
jgi:hypothetical protein